MYASESKIVMAGVREMHRTEENFRKGTVTQPKIIGLLTGVKTGKEIGKFREETMRINIKNKEEIKEEKITDL